MGAGQDAGFDQDVADFVEGAGIGPALFLQDFLAEDALAQSFEIMFQLGLGRFIVFGNIGLQFLLELFDQRVALCLGMFLGIEAIGKLGADFLFQLVVVGLVEFRRRDFAFFLAGFRPQVADRSEE